MLSTPSVSIFYPVFWILVSPWELGEGSGETCLMSVFSLWALISGTLVMMRLYHMSLCCLSSLVCLHLSTCKAELNSLEVLKKTPVSWNGVCCVFRESCASLGSVIPLLAALFPFCVFACSLLFPPTHVFLLCHVLLFQSLVSAFSQGRQEAPVLELSAGLPLPCVGSDPLLPESSIAIFVGHGWGGGRDWQQ